MADSSNSPRPLRVLHVSTERNFGGGEVQALLLMKQLAARGVSQSLACPPGAELGRLARSEGIVVHGVPMRTYLSFIDAWRLRRLCARHDLAHLHTGRASWLGSFAARLAGKPWLITRRTMRAVAPGWRANVVYGKAVIVAVSASVAEALRMGGIDPSRIEVIHDSVDLERVPEVRGRAATRESLGIGDDAFLVLGLGKLAAGKGFDVLIDAVAAIDDASIATAIAGDGPERRALHERIVSRGLENRVQLLGRRADVGDLIAACDMLAMPSRHEGLGNAAMEAMGRQRAVVASAVGGLRELVRHEVNGLLVPADDAPALAAAIMRLRQDPALRRRLAAAGPGRLDQGMRPEHGVVAYLDAYARAISRLAVHARGDTNGHDDRPMNPPASTAKDSHR